MPKKIYLIDGNNFIYRMFFALPEFATKDGKVVNAIFGMAKFFVGQLTKEKPDYLVFIRDAKGKNFRHDLYGDYKATREKMPDNLRNQIEDINKMINLMGIEVVEIDGYEADDVIGTLATAYAGNKEYELDILTGDKDLYQFAGDNIKIYDTMKKKKFGAEETKKKFGVESKYVVDYLAIVGDKSDNIPGIEGFGPQKAINLINIIGTIENIYSFIDNNILPLLKRAPAGGGISKDEEKKIKEVLKQNFGEKNAKKIFSIFKGKTFEKLLKSRENAFLSKKLATIDTNVEIKGFNLENFKFNPELILNKKLKDFFRKLEFNSLLGEEKKELKKWKDLGLKVQIIGDKQGMDELFRRIKSPIIPLIKGDENKKTIVLDTETTSLDIMKAELVGLSIYLDDKNIFYINRLHSGAKVDDGDLKEFLKKLFDLDITIVGHNIKYDLEIIDLFLNQKNTSGSSNVGQTTLF